MSEIKSYLKGDYLSSEMVSDGDFAEIMSEGKLVDGNFGKQLEAEIKLTTGIVKLYTINRTSAKYLSDAWGTETKDWIGKMIKFSKTKQNVKGELKMVLYSEPVKEPEVTEERIEGTKNPEEKVA